MRQYWVGVCPDPVTGVLYGEEGGTGTEEQRDGGRDQSPAAQAKDAWSREKLQEAGGPSLGPAEGAGSAALTSGLHTCERTPLFLFCLCPFLQQPGP